MVLFCCCCFFLFFSIHTSWGPWSWHPSFFFAHTPLGGRLGSYETKRSSDGLQDRLAQWLSPGSTWLRWNTSVSTQNISSPPPEGVIELNTAVQVVIVVFAAVVSCQSLQAHCVFQWRVWPAVWSRCAEDERETGCFSAISTTRWEICSVYRTVWKQHCDEVLRLFLLYKYSEENLHR